MKALLVVWASAVSYAAGWDEVERIADNHNVEVSTRAKSKVRGQFVSANAERVVVRSTTGEQSIAKSDVRKVRVADRSRRLRHVLIGSAIGAGVGFALGLSICQFCTDTGEAAGPLAAMGLGAGALVGLLPAPYRTVYQSK